MSEFTRGEFRTVIGEQSAELVPDKVKRIIACSGKVYHDLVRKRDERNAADVAILRVEQLYPFHIKAFAAELKKYPNATDIVWCQDEPQNQGAWFFVQRRAREHERGPALGLCRPAGLGVAGGGLRAPAPGSSRRRAARPGLREAQGLRPFEISVTTDASAVVTAARGTGRRGAGRRAG